MRLLRAGSLGLGVCAAVAVALVAGTLIRDYRSGDTAAPSEAPVAALGLPASSPTPATCDSLARIAPAPAPPLATEELGNGKKRITSAEGGWSLEVPASWFVHPGILGAGFGQAAITSYDPPKDFSGMIGPHMLPASVGVRLHVEVWANPASLPSDRFIDPRYIGPDDGSLRDATMRPLAGTNAYRAIVHEERREQQAPGGPLVTMTQERVLWVVPSTRADRMLVLYAWPLENPLWTTAEGIISTLVRSLPVAARMPIARSRDEVLAKWRFDANGVPIAGRRAEAKLMTYAEADLDSRGWGLRRLDTDPDQLVWVVAAAGPGLPDYRMGGPYRPNASGTPEPPGWLALVVSADDSRPIALAGASGSGADWPPFFDALPDRCR